MNWAYILLAYSSLFALSLIDNGRGPAYPDILKDLSIGPSLGSYIFSLASFASLAVNLTSRYWLPRFGATNTTKFSLALMGISSWGIAYAGKTSNYPVLLIFSTTLGVALAILTITMNILVARGATLEKRRRLFSGLHAVYGFSSLVAPAILSLIVTYAGSWKDYFVAVGFIPFIVLILSLTVHRSKTTTTNEENLEKGVAKRKRFLFGVFFGSYVSAEITLSSRLPYFLQEVEGMSLVEANKGLSIFFATLLIGRLTFAIKHFEIRSKTLLYSSLIMSLLIFISGRMIHPLLFSLMGISMSFFFPIAMNYLSEVFHEKSEYMTTSIMTSIGVMLSFMHWGFGIVAEAKGVSFAFNLVPTYLVLSFVCLWASRKLIRE